MDLRMLPLAGENSHKEGYQGEIQPLGVNANGAAQYATQCSPGDPIDLIQDGDKGHKPALVNASGRGRAYIDSEGFIAHTVDEEKLFPACVLENFQHGETIKEMARINH